MVKNEMENKKMDEKWRVIDTHENYAVSNTGKVKNVKFDREITPFRDKNGYLLVNLYNKGEMTTKKVHRLVLTCFVGVDDGKKQVNHIDGNKENNNIDNLEWVTQSENQIHRRKVLMKNGGGLAPRKVFCVELNKTFDSIMDAERKTRVCHQHIGKCLNGKRKTAGGMMWKEVSS
jgi:hypothetical protein